MNMKIVCIAACIGLSIGVIQAQPNLTLAPSDGLIFGAPGATVGWGFDLTADLNNWATIIATTPLNETNPNLGSYLDFISLQGGPSNGALSPGAPDWAESFDTNTFSGFGSYTIGSNAQVGDFDSGQFLVEYELFSGDPSICTNCFVSSGVFLENFTVAVSPEPGTWALMLGGCAAIGGLVRRSRGRAGRRAPPGW
jgi:hypothetical protein